LIAGEPHDSLTYVGRWTTALVEQSHLPRHGYALSQKGYLPCRERQGHWYDPNPK